MLKNGESAFMRSVVETVCALVGVEVDFVLTESRKGKNSAARQISWKLIVDLAPSITFKRIGKFFGRNHSTICNGLEGLTMKMERKEELRTIYQLAREILLDRLSKQI